jgi:DNA-binding response OmpR family regulator
MPLTILIAIANRPGLRDDLAAQLSADGHHVHQAHSSRHATALLATHPIDMLVLGALEQPTAALAFLRALRGGTLHTRAWPEVPTITLAPLVGDGEIGALRAYEAGSDHHLDADAGYLLQRAVLDAVARRARGATHRVHRVGAIEIDTATREVRVAGELVELSGMEYALLSALATDPRRVFTKAELLRDVWGFRSAGRTRTLDSHACRLRRKLSDRGARAIVNVWGVGYRLTDGEPAQP